VSNNSCCPTNVLPQNPKSWNHHTYSSSSSSGGYQPRYDQIYIAGADGTTTMTTTTTTTTTTTSTLTKRGLIYIPDIFGPHPNAYQIADEFAERGGYCVIIPDFFRGSHWPLNSFPPPNGFDSPEWMEFISKMTSPSYQQESLKPKIQQAIAILQSLGVTSIAAVGFCWGGSLAMQALTEGLIVAAASPHPSFLTTDMMTKIQGPVCLLPTKDDGQMLDLKAAAESTGHRVVYHYFEDIHHGFCSARANFEDELNRTRTKQAVDIMIKFFDDAFTSTSSSSSS
jgi:dienelactone hydrolase